MLPGWDCVGADPPAKMLIEVETDGCRLRVGLGDGLGWIWGWRGDGSWNTTGSHPLSGDRLGLHTCQSPHSFPSTATPPLSLNQGLSNPRHPQAHLPPQWPRFTCSRSRGPPRPQDAGRLEPGELGARRCWKRGKGWALVQEGALNPCVWASKHFQLGISLGLWTVNRVETELETQSICGGGRGQGCVCVLYPFTPSLRGLLAYPLYPQKLVTSLFTAHLGGGPARRNQGAIG